MAKLIVLFMTLFFCGLISRAQSRDTTILLPNRLVITSIKKAEPRVEIDTSGVVAIECVMVNDSLIRLGQRELSGKMIGYTDSSIILRVIQETSITYFRNGTIENFYYWEDEDSLKNHIDTIQFSQIHRISFDKGTFRHVRGILQSTAYLFIVGNIVALVTAFVTPKTYGSFVTGAGLMNTTGIALAAGGASFLFYPKEYRINNHPKQKRRMRWRMEVR